MGNGIRITYAELQYNDDDDYYNGKIVFKEVRFDDVKDITIMDNRVIIDQGDENVTAIKVHFDSYIRIQKI